MSLRILCDREDCDAERTMRSLEAIRESYIAQGDRKPQSENDYWHYCRVCSRTVGWRRYPEGLIKRL